MSNTKTLYGVTVAMITPFDSRDRVDLDAIRQLTDDLIDRGVNCLYPLGTTGEMYRLSVQERKIVAETVVDQAQGRVPVYIHVGAMEYDDTLELAKHAADIGADGIGAVSPAFFKVNDREMEQYYVGIAKAVPKRFPLYLYNIPQCTGNDISTVVVERIAKACSNVVGIKYSWADMVRTLEYLRINDGSFSVLLGTDALFLSNLTMGGAGIVSGIASVYPEPYVALYKAYRSNELATAKQLQSLITNLSITLQFGGSMAVLKEGLRLRGIRAGTVRKPQLDLTIREAKQLASSLRPLFETDLSKCHL